MTTPTISVGVGLGIANPGDFILDDATYGVLDGIGVLGTGYNEITADSFAVSIRRGRWSRLWDAVDAGTGSVRVWNYDRDYDPAYLLSPFSTYIVPGRPVQVQCNSRAIWTGYVDDWDLNYDIQGVSSAVLKSVDALGVLGQQQFDAWTSSGVSAATKLAAVCDQNEVAWPGALRQFDEGVEALSSDSVSWGSSVLNYAQLIARSDLGMLYAAKDGTLTFRNRLASAGLISSPYLLDELGDPILDEFGEPLVDESSISFSDDGNSIPFQGIQATIGSELLFARVGVDRVGGTNQTATVSDLDAWQLQYGPIRSLSLTGLLLASDAQSLALAEYLLSLYSAPRYRITELTVDLGNLSTADQNRVLDLDVSSIINVTYTPDRVGDPIQQSLTVQGIGHDISVSRHVVTLSTIDAPFPYFTLDSAAYGVLDEDILGY